MYEYGCELFKKRIECAIMIKVAENQELAAKGIEVPIELGSTCNACADGEACEVVFAFRIHARHFGGFTADKSAASEFAALGDTGDNATGDVNVKLAAGIVVEEEEAAGTLHEDVVDAHGNEVLADRVVTAELEGEHELGAHAVRAGDENRVLVFLADFEERAEAADGAEDARDHRALGKGLDAFNEFVAGIDGNAGSRVGKLAHGKYLE